MHERREREKKEHDGVSLGLFARGCSEGTRRRALVREKREREREREKEIARVHHFKRLPCGRTRRRRPVAKSRFCTKPRRRSRDNNNTASSSSSSSHRPPRPPRCFGAGLPYRERERDKEKFVCRDPTFFKGHKISLSLLLGFRF